MSSARTDKTASSSLKHVSTIVLSWYSVHKWLLCSLCNLCVGIFFQPQRTSGRVVPSIIYLCCHSLHEACTYAKFTQACTLNACYVNSLVYWWFLSEKLGFTSLHWQGRICCKLKTSINTCFCPEPWSHESPIYLNELLQILSDRGNCLLVTVRPAQPWQPLEGTRGQRYLHSFI